MVKLWFTIDTEDYDLWQLVLMDPITIVTVLIAYLYFVFKWGPDYMKDRKPYELRTLMLVYNAIQVVYNIVLLCLCVDYTVINARLAPDDRWGCALGTKGTLLCGALYSLNKYMDLMDTVFFVLRKKRSQITFLHVFHHVVMVTWPALSMHRPYLTDGEGTQGGIVNTVVHVIMYSYYFATIYGGSNMKSFTNFMKKHVTQVQLVQFLMLLFVFGRGTFGLCQYQWYFSAFGFYLVVVFLGLFLQLYVQLYLKSHNKQSVQ